MAVDHIKMMNSSVLNDSASSAEMNNIEAQLIRILQSHNQQIQSHPVTKKTGHARFRRAPLDASTSCVQSKPVQVKSDTKIIELNKKTVQVINSGNSSGSSSSITGGEEGTVSNGKPLFSTPPPRTFSSGKPPLPTSHRKRYRDIEVSQGLFGKASSTRGCHCCKRRRKTVIKREIKRVTTNGSSKVGAEDDIPADKYSWKKYDQKLIPGTLLPRGYYKCNSVQGCPARKHVERDSNDPTVLILIYEGEHRHHRRSSQHHNRWIKMPDSLTRVNNNNNSSSGVSICC